MNNKSNNIRLVSIFLNNPPGVNLKFKKRPQKTNEILGINYKIAEVVIIFFLILTKHIVISQSSKKKKNGSIEFSKKKKRIINACLRE